MWCAVLFVCEEKRDRESERTRKMKENRRGKSIGWMARKEKPDKIKVSFLRRRLLDGVPSHRKERENLSDSSAFFMNFL